MAEICDTNGIDVPEEVAILSGDNDELLCSISAPQLSSIQLDCRSIGEQAARLLERMMNGGAAPQRPMLVPPLRVVARQSTDLQAIDDPEIAGTAVPGQRLRQRHPNVKDILREFPVSRRWLEQRFRVCCLTVPRQNTSGTFGWNTCARS